MSTTTTTDRGILLPCPMCGEAQASVSLNLADGETFTCHECENDFTREDLQARIASWTRLLAWVDAMPTPAE